MASSSADKLPAPDLNYAGQTVWVASQHRKEQALAPVLEPALGVRLSVAEGLDTDVFGTFTRDIPRAGSPLEAALAKAQAAVALTGQPLAVATEGSFGAHPLLPWVALHTETLLWWDARQSLSLSVTVQSMETPYRQEAVRDEAAAVAFAQAVGFPAQGVLVGYTPGQDADALNPPRVWEKSLDDWPSYTDGVTQAFKAAAGGTLWLETDQRAHRNPQRMRVIAEAAHQLVAAMGSRCPTCGWPGFTVQRHEPGLPCAACGFPTPTPRLAVVACRRCPHTEQRRLPGEADPGNCPCCNP